MKKRILAVIVSLTLLVLAGCGGSGSEEKETTAAETTAAETTAAETTAGDAGADTENKNISVILMATNSDYWHMVEAGAKIAGAEFGYNVTVIGPNSESDSVGQSNMVQDAVNNKVAAIVLAPNEPKVLVNATQYAKDADVPVIIIDTNLDTDDDTLYESFIGTNNYAAGKAAAEYLIERLEPGDKVAIIRGLVGQNQHDNRSNGAQEAFEANDIEVVAIQPADSDRGKAVNVMQNILQNNPDLKAVYCTNDEMALGAYQALEGMQLQDQVLTMGFDGSFGALDSIEAGKLTGSLAQKPIDEGYLGVVAAINVIEGKPVEKNVENGFEIVDKDNVADFKADIDSRMEEAGK